MTDAPTTSPRPRCGLRPIIGTVLCRGIVPLWILSGAAFKLAEAMPRYLPRQILNDTARAGIDLDVMLATLISLEFLAIAVLVFLGRWARPMAIFMLTAFCLILLREMGAVALDVFGKAVPNADNWETLRTAIDKMSCGCFGSKSPPPYMMILIDGVLLLGVVLFKPCKPDRTPAWAWAATALTVVAASAFTFWRILAPAPSPPSSPAASAVGAPDGAIADQRVRPDAGFWFAEDVTAWVGQSRRDIDILGFIEGAGDAFDADLLHVVFYRRSCDHCQLMFRDDLANDPDLAATVLAVEVPETKTEMRGSNPWPMPDTAVRRATLSTGVDWIMQSPLALRIENGIVTCAEEGDHATCFRLGGAASAPAAGSDPAGSDPPAPPTPAPATPAAPDTASRRAPASPAARLQPPPLATPTAAQAALPRRDDYEAAVRSAMRWLGVVKVDPLELRARGYDGIKHYAEFLGAYETLYRHASRAEQREAIRTRVDRIARHVEPEAYHDLAGLDTSAFGRNSMSYLRVAWLLEAMGVNTDDYRARIESNRGRYDRSLESRGAWQREMFAIYYDHFGLERPDLLQTSYDDFGVVADRLTFDAYRLPQMYELTHWVFVAFRYGAREEQDHFDADDLAYLRAILPALTREAMRMPDPDLVAELSTCMTHLEIDDPAAPAALDFLLDRQTEDGTWGDYEMMRIEHGRFVDQVYSMHTTGVALEALVEAYGAW